VETDISNGAHVVVTFNKPLKVAANEDASWCFHIGMRPSPQDTPQDTTQWFVAQTAGVAYNDVSMKNVAGHFYQVSNKRRQVNTLLGRVLASSSKNNIWSIVNMSCSYLSPFMLPKLKRTS
jgi:hypothetical protein